MLTAPPTLPGPQRSPIPEQREQADATKQVALTPSKPRMGETPAARFVKAILRPPIKIIYYAITWMRSHKLASLITLVLLLLSISVTTRLVTGYWPFNGPSSNPIQQSIQNNPQLNPYAQVWLSALYSGDANTMIAVEKNLPPSVVPPDAGLLVGEYSQRVGMTWNAVRVISTSTAADGTQDTLVEVDMTQPASLGGGRIIVIWHFASYHNTLLGIDFVSARPSLQ